MTPTVDASVIASAPHVARKAHHCRRCGYVIHPGEPYQAVTYRTPIGLIFAKIDTHCAPHPLNAFNDITYSVPRDPPEAWGGEGK